MRALHHPIRDAEIHTFQRTDLGNGTVQWLARFFPYNTYPVFFQGVSKAVVVEQAEALRTEAIDKYEKSSIAHQEAKIKRKETAMLKKDKVNDE